MLAVGVDVGGTKIAAGLVDERGSVLGCVRVSTPDSPAATVDAIAAAVRELGAGEVPVGVGVAGFVATDRSTVALAPNLGWRGEPFGERLAGGLGTRVWVENDANAAAWAETRFGAAAGRDAVVCVTVGTGVGGGIVMDRQVWRGAFGMAGEIGHLQVVEAGRECRCGQRGCLEQYASGSALVAAAREMIAAGGPDSAGLRTACGDRAEALTGPVVTQLAASGDPAAVRLIGEVGRWLGVGLAGLAAVLDPECFVIGGGVLDAGELLLGPARSSFAARLPAGDHRPHAPVLAAVLGNEAGLVGAADLARLALLGESG